MSNASSSEPEPPKEAEQSGNTVESLVGICCSSASFIYASQILSGVVVSFYPALTTVGPQLGTEWLNDSVGAQFAFHPNGRGTGNRRALPIFRHYKLGFASIGLRRPRWSDLAYGLAAVPVYFLLYVLTVWWSSASLRPA